MRQVAGRQLVDLGLYSLAGHILSPTVGDAAYEEGVRCEAAVNHLLVSGPNSRDEHVTIQTTDAEMLNPSASNLTK